MMSVVKTIFGGLIGAAVAVFILNSLGHAAADQLTWFPLVTGVLTGIGAMIFGGRSHGASTFLSGVFAGMIALIAIMLGGDTLLLFKQQSTDFGPSISKAGIETAIKAEEAAKSETPSDPEDASEENNGDDVASDVDASDDEVAGGEVDAESEATREWERDNPDLASGYMTKLKSTLSGRVDYARYIFTFFGVLLAYQLGRGFGVKQPREEPWEEIVAEN